MIITGKKFSKPEMSRVKNGDIVFAENLPDKRQRLDLLLTEKCPAYNRSTLQNFIKSGYVSVDDKIIKKPNAEIITEKYLDGKYEKQNLDIKLTIPKREEPADLNKIKLYEDGNVLVVNKPAGLLSMAKGEFTLEPTLEDYGLLVHRLDRDTSGVVILAKNEAARGFLRKQFQERKAHKTYYAIVCGRPKLDAAKIDLPIERNLKKPTTFLVGPKGKPSETYYQVIKSTSDSSLSLLELRPTTGRTHQLRVHLKYLGCPILGDKVYNQTCKIKADRLFLHAGSLEITIPGEDGGVRTTFTAPLPPEFNQRMES